MAGRRKRRRLKRLVDRAVGIFVIALPCLFIGGILIALAIYGLRKFSG